MIRGKEQARIMGKFLEKRRLRRKCDTIRHRMIREKKQARIMGKFLENRGLRSEELYIETQNDTREGAFKCNGKGFRKTRVRERRQIHSDTK
jgi:hypothetical protein